MRAEAYLIENENELKETLNRINTFIDINEEYYSCRPLDYYKTLTLLKDLFIFPIPIKRYYIEKCDRNWYGEGWSDTIYQITMEEYIKITKESLQKEANILEEKIKRLEEIENKYLTNKIKI